MIHHNPDCGTSRNVLAMIITSGAEPIVVDYLQTGWTEAQLWGLFAAADLTPRDALRVNKSPAETKGLPDPSISDDALVAAMVAHPVLVNRPIVCSPRGVGLCRPSELVLDLLDRLPPGLMFKEDGEMLINEAGQRVG